MVLDSRSLTVPRADGKNLPMNMTCHAGKVLVLGCLLSSSALLGAAEADGTNWVSLFNGKDLTGWVNVHNVTAEVKDGNLHISKGMGWLRSEKEYGDFVLELEWRALEAKYDSGVFLRCIKDGKPWPTDGWQVNLRYDLLGALVRGYSTVVPAPGEKVPMNQWSKLRLEVRGKKCMLFLNGEKAWEFEKLDKDRGYVGIQVEDRIFDFRNIRIQELK
jgi:hypothetical protein